MHACGHTLRGRNAHTVCTCAWSSHPHLINMYRNGKQQSQGFLQKSVWLLADFSQAPLLSPLEWQPQEGGCCYM